MSTAGTPTSTSISAGLLPSDLPPLMGTKPSDRRGFDRTPLGVLVEVYEVDGAAGRFSEPFSATAVDVSRTGMGLRSRRMLYPSGLIAVVFRIKDQAARRILFGLVKHSRYDGESIYHTGVVLTARPTHPKVEQWVQQLSRQH